MFKEYDGNEYDEPMVTRYQKMVDDDAQIILIEGGSNDSNGKTKDIFYERFAFRA